jgi:hypothetical protein
MKGGNEGQGGQKDSNEFWRRMRAMLRNGHATTVQTFQTGLSCATGFEVDGA